MCHAHLYDLTDQLIENKKLTIVKKYLRRDYIRTRSVLISEC